MTMDGTDPVHPNALHPDQHSLVTNPANPLQFIETNDGGVMRSSGALVDRSSWCDTRGLSGTNLIRCHQMLSAIPSKLESVNSGLTTLQFQSLSVSPHDVDELQGGTQDNGTWENYGSKTEWRNTMIGDGGQSGFDVAVPEFRFHNFTGVSTDVNFNNGNLADWIWISDPVGGRGVLRAGDQRSERVRHALRGHELDRLPHQDVRARLDDPGRGEPALQRVDRRLHRPVRRLGAS